MTPDEFRQAYEREGHAIQSGIAMLMHVDAKLGERKHLRTGLNLVMRDLGSIGALLIEKGIITEAEYAEAILKGLHEEKEMIRARLEDYYKTKITLA